MKTVVSLDGIWEFLIQSPDMSGVNELAEVTGVWRAIPVPGAWETQGVPKSFTGPVWYRKTFDLSAIHRGSRYWLDFDGVSYYCEVWVNGQYAGNHQGSWDAFSFEVTNLLRVGLNTVIVKVEKPGERFPLRQSLTGFLPYVQGFMFGGIWQSVYLRETGKARIRDIYIKPNIHARQAMVEVSFDSSEPCDCHLDWLVFDPGGNPASRGRQVVPANAAKVVWTVDIPRVQLWSQVDPKLYTVTVSVPEGDVPTEERARFGMREVTVTGSRIYLNGDYVFPRGVLHWGWYPDLLAPNPSVDRIRKELTQMRQLGYNMVKHCLYIPTRAYFDVADELGFLTWLEMPMWDPDVTEDYAARMHREYEAILRQVRNHPSVLMYTIGCELNQNVPAELLGSLYNLTKEVTDSPLVRDNSGSAECYGGSNVEFADYYDNHFYAEPHWYRPLLDTFTARARGAKPWLFGEFCDCDTYRDLHEIITHNNGRPPWWIIEDEEINPKGVRWEYSVVDHLNRVEKGDLQPHATELTVSSRRQAVAMRKLILETIRSYEEVSGYVILNISDTPVATPGMVDDLGRVKFTPEELTPFNSDTVLVLGWDRRRVWESGGDRPFFLDVYNYVSGSLVRPRITVSYGGKEPTRKAVVAWRARLGETDVADGVATFERPINPGDVVELAVAEFVAPTVGLAQKLTFRAEAVFDDETRISNSWNLWVYPRRETELNLSSFRLYDPGYHLHYLEGEYPDLKRFEKLTSGAITRCSGIIASILTPELVASLERGGRVLLIVSHEDPILTKKVPFWRESLKLFRDHPIWEAFPHEGFSDTQFYGLATARAFVPEALRQRIGGRCLEKPVLRRVDGRHLTLLDYIVEYQVGSGILLATTLAFQGGSGNQPSTFRNNVAGQYLFGAMIDYLHKH